MCWTAAAMICLVSWYKRSSSQWGFKKASLLAILLWWRTYNVCSTVKWIWSFARSSPGKKCNIHCNEKLWDKRVDQAYYKTSWCYIIHSFGPIGKTIHYNIIHPIHGASISFMIKPMTAHYILLHKLHFIPMGEVKKLTNRQ